jgi:WD repeat-containing protein 48
MDETWHRCVSGGADGRVYLTDLGSRRSVLLFEEAEAVVEVLLHAERDGSEKVWTATMGADVRRWSAEAPKDEYHRKTKDDHRRARRAGEQTSTRADVVDGAPGTWFASAQKPPREPPKDPPEDGATEAKERGEGRTKAKKPPGPTPYRSAPEMVLAGSAPVTEHRQLADRRRILARDAAGGLAVWDVPSFSRVSTYPPGPPEALERVAAELNGATPVSVPSWFQANARSGSLAVTLTPSSAFQAEAYAVDMGLRHASDELKVNLGVQVVHALLRDWARRRRRAIKAQSEGKSHDADGDGGDSDTDGDGGDADANSAAADSGSASASASAEKAAKKVDLAGLSPCDDAGVFPTPSRKPLLLFEQPDRPAGAPTVLMPTECLRGTDEEEDALPEWIVDVSAGTYRVPDAPKTSFYLVPSEDDPGLPKLSQGKVTAPRVLGVAKVCKYVASKLELEDAEGREAVDLVEMRCAGEALDPGMSVATVRERVWRTPGEDVQLVYSLKPGVRLKKQG